MQSVLIIYCSTYAIYPYCLVLYLQSAPSRARRQAAAELPHHVPYEAVVVDGLVLYEERDLLRANCS